MIALEHLSEKKVMTFFGFAGMAPETGGRLVC